MVFADALFNKEIFFAHIILRGTWRLRDFAVKIADFLQSTQ